MRIQNLVAFSGGVGGAKLVLGLASILSSEQLTVIANTADDFEHLGLFICPDLDTVMYTLAGISHPQQGWGIKDESFNTMSALDRLQGETWFRLGDQDIATHLLRSQALREGNTLSDVTQMLFSRLNIAHRVLPMCDEKVSTIVHTDNGELAFQQYFVREQCRPNVTGFHFAGIEKAQLPRAQSDALAQMDALVICPSNPFVSVAPILAVAGVKERITARNAPVVVVSPIVAGMAIKGPAAKMMQELKMPVTALAVAEYYQDIASHFVLDAQDECYREAIEAMGLQVLCCNTVMQSLDDRKNLATAIVEMLNG